MDSFSYPKYKGKTVFVLNLSPGTEIPELIEELNTIMEKNKKYNKFYLYPCNYSIIIRGDF